MQKVILGQRPKSIAKQITFPLPGGEVGAIKMSYIYRTRVEFGALLDEPASPLVTPESMSQSMSLAVDSSADYIMRIADGWDVEAPFSRESVWQLCNEVPSAATAIIQGYREAIVEGRLGN